MTENEKVDKKSLKLFTNANPDWRALARDCVCFANARGGKILIGIEDHAKIPPDGQKISFKLPEQIRKRIGELTINVGIKVEQKTADNYQSILATEFSRLIQSQNDKLIKNWLGNLLNYEIIQTKGKTKGTEYFVSPKILKNAGVLKSTSLKHIQDHRLEALILTDIERFQPTKVSEIHQRIGKEIPLRRIKYILKKLKDECKIIQTGKTSGAIYSIKQN